MKTHCKILATALATALRLAWPLDLPALSAHAAGVPTEWTVRIGPRSASYQAERRHGDALALKASLVYNGQPLAYSGPARLYAQTNGMGTTWWDLAPCTVVSNTLQATWLPSFDTGADVVDLFLGGPSNYQAAARIRFLPSPGTSPNALPLPIPVLDFNTIEVRNPPYYTSQETDAQIAAATNAISAPDFSSANTQLVATIEATAPAPGNYEAVSNAAMKAFSQDGGNVYGNLRVGSLASRDTSILLSTNGHINIHSVASTRMTHNGLYKSDRIEFIPFPLPGIDISILYYPTNTTGVVAVVSQIDDAESRMSEQIIAATNAIPEPDFSSANTQLVATIEATVPSGVVVTNSTGEILLDAPLKIMPSDSGNAGSLYIGGDADVDGATMTVGAINPASYGGSIIVNGANGEQIVIGASDAMTAGGIKYNGVNIVVSKQDALPYPTNAIPFAAIADAPTPPSVFYDSAGGAASVSGMTLTYQAASNSVGSVALLAGTNVLHITAPSEIPNRVRDFGLTVTTEDAATITLDTTVSWRFDAASTNLAAGSWNRVYCTESPANVFTLQLWTPDSAQEATP